MAGMFNEHQGRQGAGAGWMRGEEQGTWSQGWWGSDHGGPLAFAVSATVSTRGFWEGMWPKVDSNRVAPTAGLKRYWTGGGWKQGDQLGSRCSNPGLGRGGVGAVMVAGAQLAVVEMLRRNRILEIFWNRTPSPDPCPFPPPPALCNSWLKPLAKRGSHHQCPMPKLRTSHVPPLTALFASSQLLMPAAPTSDGVEAILLSSDWQSEAGHEGSTG